MAFNKEKVLDGARKLAEKNQFEKAVKEYLRVVQEDPRDIKVWLKIGDLHVKRGSKQDATEVYLKVARVYAEEGIADKAIAVFKQVLKIDPHLVDVNLRLAELYRQKGLLADAMQHFEAVAGHFHREGNTKEALATVRQLVDLDPDNVATRIKLAELYSKEGLTNEAIAEFARATDALRKQGRQEDFIKVAERLLWHQPENLVLNRELAALYLRKNDPRRALQKLQICFKADARDVETLAMLAQAFQALDQGAKTVSVLRELAKVHDDNKHPARAVEVFRKILEFVPNDPDALARVTPKASPPAAAAPASRSNPQLRAPTPPPVARAATPPPVARPAGKAAFSITSDLPAIGHGKMTGAVPLLDEDRVEVGRGRLSSADDFSRDLRADARGRHGSAAAEKHADEIARALTDAGIYLKYRHYQKAVEHLRRVFDLDPDNLEARERLKDVYVAQGREPDALAELGRLAEAVVGSDPARAMGYLREALALDGAHAPTLAFARKHRLDLSMGEEELPPRDYSPGAVQSSSGAVQLVEDDFDDLGFDEGPRAPMMAPRRGSAKSYDDVDDFDPQDLISPQGSPAPSRPPGPVLARSTMPAGVAASARAVPPVSVADDEDFSLDAVPAETRQVDVHDIQALATAAMETDDLEFEDGVVDAAAADPGARWGGPTPVTPIARPLAAKPARVVTPAPDTWSGPGAWAAAKAQISSPRQAVPDDRLDEPEVEADIDARVAAEFTGSMAAAEPEAYEDLPFDPEAARAFDAQVDDGYAEARQRLELEPDEHDRPTGVAVDAAPEPTHAAAQATDVVDGTEALALPHLGSGDGDSLDATSFEAEPPSVDGPIGRATAPALAAPPGTLEDDLDEAEFYVSQGMVAAALEILEGLRARHPGHPLVEAKFVELSGGEGSTASVDEPLASELAAAAVDPPSGATQALELDELDELEPVLDDDDLPGGGPQRTPAASRPGVMLEKPVEDGDADTHYDLGQAYKEMGLYDEALKAFEKAARGPSREVQARLMMGLCYREQANASAAVSQFKQALHAQRLTDLERQSLYYELGVAYEGLADPGEALYYLEMVVKRDAAFLDANERVTRLRATGARGRAGSSAS